MLGLGLIGSQMARDAAEFEQTLAAVRHTFTLDSDQTDRRRRHALAAARTRPTSATRWLRNWTLERHLATTISLRPVGPHPYRHRTRWAGRRPRR